MSAALARLHSAAFVMPRPWSATEIAELLASPLCFLIEAPDGFLIGRVVAGEAELLTVAVRPLAQGRGIGGRLVQSFVDEARLRGADTAFLEVAETNAAARLVYARSRFYQTGRRRGYYHAADGTAVDALVLMRKI